MSFDTAYRDSQQRATAFNLDQRIQEKALPQPVVKEKRWKVSEQTRDVHVGDVVIYYDPVGKPHNALVTAVWSKTCLNVVIISSDETKTDPYGRQIERYTSLGWLGQFGQVYGNNWGFADEAPNPIVAPLEK